MFYLDHLENISAGVLFLYLLSSLSDPPIGDCRGNTVLLLLAKTNFVFNFKIKFPEILIDKSSERCLLKIAVGFFVCEARWG